MADTTTKRPSSRPASRAAVKTGNGVTADVPSDAVIPAFAMTPEAALARHVEWLDFALGAATAEERWRRERLAKADKGNRAKRTDRLADVQAEIDELTALLAGIRDLQARTTAGTAPARRRGRPPGSKNGTGRRAATAAKTGATKPTTARATTAKATTAKPATARATTTRKATTAKSTTTRRATTRKAAPASPAASGTAAAATGTSTAATAAPTTSAPAKPAAARRRSTTPSTAG